MQMFSQQTSRLVYESTQCKCQGTNRSQPMNDEIAWPHSYILSGILIKGTFILGVFCFLSKYHAFKIENLVFISVGTIP